MEWDWEKIYAEREKRQKPERDRLLALSDAEAEKLDVSERYQRMRYQRAIEAVEWLADLRHKMPKADVVPIKKRYTGKRSSKIVYDRD